MPSTLQKFQKIPQPPHTVAVGVFFIFLKTEGIFGIFYLLRILKKIGSDVSIFILSVINITIFTHFQKKFTMLIKLKLHRRKY